MNWMQSVMWPFATMTDALLTAAVAVVAAIAAGAITGYWRPGKDSLQRFEEKH
jgi:hypothetical protein